MHRPRRVQRGRRGKILAAYRLASLPAASTTLFRCATCRRLRLHDSRNCDGAKPPRPHPEEPGKRPFAPLGWWSLDGEWAHRDDLVDDDGAPEAQWACWVMDYDWLHLWWLTVAIEADDGFAPPVADWSPFFRRVRVALKAERAAQHDARTAHREANSK